jgi:hypothetical protein
MLDRHERPQSMLNTTPRLHAQASLLSSPHPRTFICFYFDAFTSALITACCYTYIFIILISSLVFAFHIPRWL